MPTQPVTPCPVHNGTYGCQRALNHDGRHRKVEIEYSPRNEPVRRLIHTWAHAYGPVNTTRIAV